MEGVNIAIQYDLIRDEVQKGNLNIQYCNMEGMVADMMTKGLFATCFTKLREIAGVTTIPSTSDYK